MTLLCEFIGKNMTAEQATALLNEAKENLSEAHMERLGTYVASPFYSGSGHLYAAMSEYQAECGQF